MKTRRSVSEMNYWMSNKSRGTAFEREFAQALSGHGFWVHRMQDNHNGQPFDIIAARGGETLVFDCKDCRRDVFRLARIEENQRLAMKLWFECGNHEGLFALRFADGIRILSYTVAVYLEGQGIEVLDKTGAGLHAMKFEEWMESYEGNDQQ